MVNVFLGVICAIILFVTLETIKYNKERNERNNNRDTKVIHKARVKIRNNSKEESEMFSIAAEFDESSK